MLLVKILLSALAGALIGAVTNYIAIMMLFRPYKRTLGIQGVIPGKIVEFSEKLAEGTMNFTDSALQDDRVQQMILEYATNIIKKSRFISKLFLLFAYPVIYFERENMQEYVNEGINVLGDIIKYYIVNLDIHETEIMVRKVLQTEFRMLTVYGALLGFLMGLASALINIII